MKTEMEDAMSKTSKKIRVLICNRFSLFREGIKTLLEKGTPIEIVGEVNTGRAAIEQLERLKPDVVLMDVSTADLSGFEATQRIKALDPDVKVLILSLNDDTTLLSRCLQAGAAGYIRKDERTLHLQAAIQDVFRTGEYRNSAAATGLAARSRSGNGSSRTVAAPSDEFKAPSKRAPAREGQFGERRMGAGK